MSHLITDITYQQAIRAIREVVLDTNPVQCFKVFGQDFVFSKKLSQITLIDEFINVDEVEKHYDLINLLRDKQVSIEILSGYIANEYTKHTVDFDFQSIEDKKTVSRKHYFSTAIIESTMEEFYAYYMGYTGIPKTTNQLYDKLDYYTRKKIVLWTAFYLVDRKRMNYAATGEMMRNQQSDGEYDGCSSGGIMKNTDSTITTRIGEVFSMSESTVEDGKGLQGFTSLWGDKYSYFTKLQLWIRDKFERQFKDFSLRDDAMLNSTFTIEKSWEPYAWVNTLDFESDGRSDRFHPNR